MRICKSVWLKVRLYIVAITMKIRSYGNSYYTLRKGENEANSKNNVQPPRETKKAVLQPS
jgi:hypothetical protein